MGIFHSERNQFYGRICQHSISIFPPQSPTVRGLAAILANGLNGSTAEDVLSVPADFYLDMDLQSVLTLQRLNGLSGMLAHMKQIAVRLMKE